MRSRLRLVRAAAALAVAGAVVPACGSSGLTGRVRDLVGGDAAVSVLSDRSAAVKREAYRIDGMGPMARRTQGPGGMLHGYPVLAGPVPVDDASAAALAGVLLDDATYLWDSAKLCEFAPGVLVRETRGAAVVDVLLCFSCDEVEIRLDGKTAGREDTDPRRADLVRIAKGLFPEDAGIAGLRE